MEFQNFESNKGKINFAFYQNNSNILNAKITIRDGDYLDKYVIRVPDLPLIPEKGKEK